MDQEKKGDDLVNQAEKKLKSWSWSGGKYDEAADILEKAANAYKVAKAWEKAADVYKRFAELQTEKLDNKYEAASALVDAANCYKKININNAFECLKLAVDSFIDMGRLNMAARNSKDIAELYEKQEDVENAMIWFEKAADLFASENANSSVNQMRLKIAEYAALSEQYKKAIDILESVAKESLENNLLKYSSKGYLLNAGICLMCTGDKVAITNAIERYHNLDPSFGGSRECRFLEELSHAIEEDDLDAFTDSVKEFDSMSRLDNWKTTLLLRAKNKISEDDESIT